VLEEQKRDGLKTLTEMCHVLEMQLLIYFLCNLPPEQISLRRISSLFLNSQGFRGKEFTGAIEKVL
jgi:hypothetical protein